MRLDLTKQTPKLRLVEETSKQIIEFFITHTSIVQEIQSKVEHIKTPIEETIPKRLDDREIALRSSLTSTQHLQDEVDDASRWLKKMKLAVENQSPLSADHDVSERQLNDQSLFVDEIAR